MRRFGGGIDERWVLTVVLDPIEGRGSDGSTRTGVARDRVPERFEPVIDAAIDAVQRHGPVSLHLYGSVATGMAIEPVSDVDLLAIGLPAVCRDASVGPGSESEHVSA